MKKLLIVLFATCSLSFVAKADLFVDTVFAKVALYEPYMIPVPWFNYNEEPYLWGEYNVYGADVGLIWSQSRDVCGLGVGIYLQYERLYGLQVGFYNRAQKAYGLQVGVVNDANDMCGVQVGLVNVIRESPVPVLPILNLRF